jgi:hypothetical protein
MKDEQKETPKEGMTDETMLTLSVGEIKKIMIQFGRTCLRSNLDIRNPLDIDFDSLIDNDYITPHITPEDAERPKEVTAEDYSKRINYLLVKHGYNSRNPISEDTRNGQNHFVAGYNEGEAFAQPPREEIERLKEENKRLDEMIDNQRRKYFSQDVYQHNTPDCKWDAERFNPKRCNVCHRESSIGCSMPDLCDFSKPTPIDVPLSFLKPVEAGEEKGEKSTSLSEKIAIDMLGSVKNKIVDEDFATAFFLIDRVIGMLKVGFNFKALPSTPTEQGKGKTKEEILNPCVFRSKNIYSETNGMVSEEDALECMQEYADQQHQDWPEVMEFTDWAARNDLRNCSGMNAAFQVFDWLKDWKGKE